MFYKRFFLKADEFYHTDQIDSFLQWSEDRKYTDRAVFINLPMQKGVYAAGFQSKRLTDGIFPGFIICETGKLQESLREKSFIKQVSLADSWYKIAFATGIEIWECKNYYANNFLPLRFGLTKNEKKVILEYVRRRVEEKVCETEQESPISILEPLMALREGESVSLDVAIWIDGTLRSSVIVRDTPFFNALSKGSDSAVWDLRMKPIESDEISRARIEVNIFSDLNIPLREADKADFGIEARRGYSVSDGEKKGWYLPMVFNCVNFSNMNQLIQSLIREKAQITESSEKLRINTFLVDSMIEDIDQMPLELTGPVISGAMDKGHAFKDKIVLFGDNLSDFICKMQDSHGGMPLYIDPIHQKYGRMDWVRLGCATHGLAAYGNVRMNEKFVVCAKKSLNYIERYVLKNNRLPVSTRVHTLAYAVRAAGIYKEDSLVKELLEFILKNLNQTPYSPIGWAMISSVLAEEVLRGKKNYLDKSIEIADIVFNDFLSKKTMQSTQLANYPELASAYRSLATVTENSNFLGRAFLVEEWLIGHQLLDGSFPGNGKTSYAYTRGTGKIFEVLARDPNKYELQLAKCFEWLLTMQYTNNNTYFVDQNFKDNIMGGMRNSYADGQSWIDGAAHPLLGVSRLIKKAH